MTYREVDGVPMCLLNMECLREADHSGRCVLDGHWLDAETWAEAVDPVELRTWGGFVIVR